MIRGVIEESSHLLGGKRKCSLFMGNYFYLGETTSYYDVLYPCPMQELMREVRG
jgi:hypothetical protein